MMCSRVIIIVLSVIVRPIISSDKPNIVFIIADDLGWHDVSYHGHDDILTPNIDSLAYSGVALKRYYTHCQCTPSRSAILTGKFAHKTGMQGYPLTQGEDRGLPLTEKVLPQYLKELGYATHLVGKWHVGHSHYAYLPTFRGYDSHFGNRGGFIDYYEYLAEETWVMGKVSGLDLFRNVTPDWNAEGYVTDLYTTEAETIIMSHDVATPLFLTVGYTAPHAGNVGAALQATNEDVRAKRYVESPERRILAAMMKSLDNGVGKIVESLQQKGILENTIIVFVADNGGPTSGTNAVNYSLNLPLRGQKMTSWEGGIRVSGLIWSANMAKKGYVWNQYMHAVDWLPTLLRAINGTVPNNIDGINLWDSIILNQKTKRDVMYEIDDYTGYSSIIQGHYKLVTGNIDPNISNYMGRDLLGFIGQPPSYIETVKNSKVFSILNENSMINESRIQNLRNEMKLNCGGKQFNGCYTSRGAVCLYNILNDPCEMEDLSLDLPEVARSLLTLLDKEKESLVPRSVPLYRDPRALPRLHNHTWTSFMDLTNSVKG